MANTFDLEVLFTGICAFVPEKDGVRYCVVMPNATELEPTPSTIDGITKRTTHFGLIHMSSRHVMPDMAQLDGEFIWHLNRQRIFLELSDDDREANQPNTPNLDDVLSMEKLVNDPAPDPAIVADVPPTTVLAQFLIDAGRLESALVSTRIWKVTPTVKPPEYKQPFAHGVALRFSKIEKAALVAVSFDRGRPVERLPLQPTYPNERLRIVVTNVCYDNPLEWPRGEEPPRPDVDVAWYYELLSQDARRTLAADIKKLPLKLEEKTVPIPNVASLGVGGSNCSPKVFPKLAFGF